MKPSDPPIASPGWTNRRINAMGLLAGIVAGFLLAVLLGYQASHYSKPSNFVRFHQWINAQTIYYPPFRMLEHIALSRWHPGQTVVIVGGNSILNGVSQMPPEIWTRRLQELLGPEKYVVVNLAFGGGGPTEGGAVVAEALLRRGIPVVLVTNMGSGTPPYPIAGIYGYFYWEAKAQGALFPQPDRDAKLAQFMRGRSEAQRSKEDELSRAAYLNAHLYFQELWHEVGLHSLFTVWNYKAQGNFWRPRNEWPDQEISSKPVADRFKENFEAELEITRSFTVLIGRKDADGKWGLAPDVEAEMRRQIHAVFPAPLRPRTLMVLCQNAPAYRRRLTPDERARDDAVWPDCAAVLRDEGVACVINGLDFEDVDYHDRTHLAPSGGYKLAALVAGEIRKLNSDPAPR